MEIIEEKKPLDFIRTIVKADVEAGKNNGAVITRFPPEPNGYLHLGHAKAICIDFDIAREFGGRTNLRFDDTNPTREEEKFVEAIQEDLRWLGYEWGDNALFASDYYQQLHDFAIALIKKAKAYVDDLSAEEIREHRGTLTEPGRESPHRDRSVEENLELFRRMREGEFEDGSRVLRAKIDMASANLNMRDPVLYRILHASHQRTGNAWPIYPMYDFAHPLSDALEGITHSLCSLEFQDHRPLYNWVVEESGAEVHPQQIEFARLNLTYTLTSKRKLGDLVREGRVTGWDDPRLPTLRGLRRRGFPPEAIRAFCDDIGVAKRDSVVDWALLEHHVRETLNRTSLRVMGVLRPLKVVIENYPEGLVEEMEVVNNPEDPSAGTRKVPFSRTLYIEREDFMEDPPKKFFRLAPGREVRLRSAYLVTCTDVVKDDRGEIVELRCSYDPDTRGGSAPDGRRVKATMHWVSTAHAVPAEVRLYDHLFTTEDPTQGGDYLGNLNPDSLQVLEGCQVEPGLGDARPGSRYQFERIGYFSVDPDSSPGQPVFNRTVTLRDAWARIRKGKKPTNGPGDSGATLPGGGTG